MVQDAANAHRSKLAELAELLQALRDNPQLLNDEEFSAKLKEVQDKVDKLLEDALNTASMSLFNIVTMHITLSDFLKYLHAFYFLPV